jgi:hypothetical protein
MVSPPRKVLCARPVCPSLPPLQPLATPDLSTISAVFPFQSITGLESHGTQPFHLHVFFWLHDSFPFSAENYSLYRCTTVSYRRTSEFLPRSGSYDPTVIPRLGVLLSFQEHGVNLEAPLLSHRTRLLRALRETAGCGPCCTMLLSRQSQWPHTLDSIWCCHCVMALDFCHSLMTKY